jgi:hypothetical protein
LAGAVRGRAGRAAWASKEAQGRSPDLRVAFFNPSPTRHPPPASRPPLCFLPLASKGSSRAKSTLLRLLGGWCLFCGAYIPPQVGHFAAALCAQKPNQCNLRLLHSHVPCAPSSSFPLGCLLRPRPAPLKCERAGGAPSRNRKRKQYMNTSSRARQAGRHS